MRTEAEKISRRKYMASDKGKAMAARSAARYRATENGRKVFARCAKRYQKTLNGRRNAVKAVQRNNAAHPDRYRARTIAGNAIRSGKLAKQPCEICGALDVQAHHEDYSRPLDVRWRCFEHHLNEHNKRKVKG